MGLEVSKRADNSFAVTRTETTTVQEIWSEAQVDREIANLQRQLAEVQARLNTAISLKAQLKAAK